MHAMTPDEIRAFLLTGTRTAIAQLAACVTDHADSERI